MQPGQIGGKDIAAQLIERRNGAIGRHRVGGIGLDEQDRGFAAQQISVEADRKGDDELHLAPFEQLIRLSLVNTADDLEVIAVPHGRHVRPGERAGVGHDDGRGQLLGIGVDGVAKQNQLHDRNGDDHAEGQPVAFELDEFLEQNAVPAGK